MQRGLGSLIQSVEKRPVGKMLIDAGGRHKSGGVSADTGCEPKGRGLRADVGGQGPHDCVVHK